MDELESSGLLAETARVEVRLYGSLALTGVGHGSDRAVILGLLGRDPAKLDAAAAQRDAAAAVCGGRILLGGRREIAFNAQSDLKFIASESLPFHPNGMRLLACDEKGRPLCDRVMYSVGGGFVADHAGRPLPGAAEESGAAPFPFSSAGELLSWCEKEKRPISEIVMDNELRRRSAAEVRAQLLEIWSVMSAAIEAGLRTDGELPGGLRLKRRAPELNRNLGKRLRQGRD